MDATHLLQRYRRDRRKLLEFILSSVFIKQIQNPCGAPIDLDTLSTDYVLERVNPDGGVVDVAEATRRYFEELDYPITTESQFGNAYFFLSDPDASGSPPHRTVPSVTTNQSTHRASSSSGLFEPSVEDGHEAEDAIPTTKPVAHVEDMNISSFGLPDLRTGLSEDDLRESAYEILIASMVLYGFEVYSVEDRKKGKSSKFLSGLKSKKDIQSQPESPESHSELLNTIRVQMQISEAMDVCIRRTLMQFASRTATEPINIPLMSLGLLTGMSRADFLHEKAYMQWKKRQANLLEELLCCANSASADFETDWDATMSPSERDDVLSTIRVIVSQMSSLPTQFGLQGETCYWTAGYGLNIRIYEKLLLGLFDILEECQLMEAADEIMALVKLTWSILGITQKIHDAMFGWVLFQQFLQTDEALLLESATFELKKALSAEDDSGNEGLYISSLVCSCNCNGHELKLSVVQAIFFSIGAWCNCKLQDYHLHFTQNPCNLRRVLTLGLEVGLLFSSACSQFKLQFTTTDTTIDSAAKRLGIFVQRSIEASFRRVLEVVDLKSKAEKRHALAVLAVEMKLLAEIEFSVFYPVLSLWCPEAGIISARQIHGLYGEKLKPFLAGVSCLSEDVKSVLSQADMLDIYLSQFYYSACEESNMQSNQSLDHYQVGKIAGPIILDWVIAQHSRIMDWTGRAVDLEDWGPLSTQQKQAVSAIEVFRIIEETVDQFFGMNLPMDITHLQALLSVIFHSLDAYLLKVVNQLVEKSQLFPPVPPLTRYKETVIPSLKKKLVESTYLDQRIDHKLRELTMSRLCVILNTLQYIQKQIGILGDCIRKSWSHVRLSDDQRWTKHEPGENSESAVPTCGESVDELFVTTFDCIKDATSDAISKIRDFAGTKVVFWDLRDSFLSCLYRGGVEGARMDGILPGVDTVLDHICSLLDDSVRDLMVLSVFQALLEGFVWVILDGGPSRAFSDSDIDMLEDDLNILKDFFVADGEGLPRSLVEKEAVFAHEILSLFLLQTETVIKMLMAASEHIATGSNSFIYGHRNLNDADTLIRVLCHKKDREASKFLEMQYQLPASSEYDDAPVKDSSSRSPLSDLLQLGSSFRWSEESQSSFRSMKKKLQKATSEIRYAHW